MNAWSRHTAEWLLGSIMTVLLCTACSSDYDEEVVTTPKLKIHVYVPGHPVITRADIGPVNPIQKLEAEKYVWSLHIWVFRHDNGSLVGYLHPSANKLMEQGTYLMDVTDEFANERPSVDVYVLANATADNCGLTTALNESTTRTQLDNALIDADHFGLTNHVTVVPNDGLPMSGVLKEQTVGGEAPVLTTGTVQVVRAVSKVRFIFSQAKTDDRTLTINSISFNDGMIPTTEYLFLNAAYTDRSSRPGGGYVTGATPFTPDDGFTVPQSVNPGIYVYTGGQTGQQYEDLINNELTGTEPELAEVGPYYLRESDKLIKGNINYQIGTDPAKDKEFTMAAAGDFSRNHTWIVYGYFAGNDNLRIIAVSFTPWTTLPSAERTVYNW